MGIFPLDLRTHQHTRQTVLPCPLFHMRNQKAPDSAATRLARDDQSADLSARLRMQMMRHADIDPADHFFRKAGNVDDMIRQSGQELNPLLHDVRRDRITEFPA